MTTGERIKQRRLELKMSVDELAKKLNKNRATIYRYESNEIENFPTSILIPLAKALETTPTYLMGWESLNDEDVANVFANDYLEESIDSIRELSQSEKTHFKTYIQLLEINRKKVDEYTMQLLSLQQMEFEVQAAHARTDLDVPENSDTSDNDIMDDPNF